MALSKLSKYEYNKDDLIPSSPFKNVYKAKNTEDGEICLLEEIRFDTIIANYQEKTEFTITQDFLKQTKEKILEKIEKYSGAINNKKNPYLVKIFEYFEEENSIYIVSEFCEGGNLKEIIDKDGGKLNEREALQITYQIILGLAALHDEANKIVHKKIRFDTIYMKNNIYKIGNYGFASQIGEKLKIDNDNLVKYCVVNNQANPDNSNPDNSNPDIAPEDFTRQNEVDIPILMFTAPEHFTFKAQTDKVDVWAQGWLLHFMLTGTHYFQQPNAYINLLTDNEGVERRIPNAGIVYNILNRPYFAPDKIELQDLTKDLLQKLLKKNLTNRASSNDLILNDVFEFCRNEKAFYLDTYYQRRFFPNTELKGSDIGLEKLSEILINFDNLNQLYCKNSIIISRFPDQNLAVFLIIKISLQRSSALLINLRKKLMPRHKLLNLDDYSDHWDYFMRESHYTNQLNSVTKECYNTRNLFEQYYMENKKKFEGISQIPGFLNDDLNDEIDANDIIFCIKEIVIFLRDQALANNDNELMNTALSFCISYKIEKRGKIYGSDNQVTFNRNANDVDNDAMDVEPNFEVTRREVETYINNFEN